MLPVRPKTEKRKEACPLQGPKEKKELPTHRENTPLTKKVSTNGEETCASKSQDDVQFLERECVSPYKFNPVDEEWQVYACSTLGLGFIRSNGVRPGGPNVSLKPHDTHTIRRITGDGNCLFTSFSYITTGSEDQHLAIRLIIINHMLTIAHLLLGTHIPNGYDAVEDYISDNKMDQTPLGVQR